MSEDKYFEEGFDASNLISIYEYSRFLIGHSLHALFGESVHQKAHKGKGGLGQMVEELFFKYDINSNRVADFEEAKVELKCTPLLRQKNDTDFRIKERLVCTMIDYFEISNTSFEDSHLLAKCRLMLILFYLHQNGVPVYDHMFFFRILWLIPPKDLLVIKKDYETIAEKVRKGEAHLISEGDTIYLGACRKGQKGDQAQRQPYSPIKANKRAFSLKPAYMRHVLRHVLESGTDHYTNYSLATRDGYELVSAEELERQSFEQIILGRFKPYFGLDYLEICAKLGIKPYQSKSKYADVAALIASNSKSKRLAEAEEFVKSGIVAKTVRLRSNGIPKEAMSFKNIDYQEVHDNADWLESEAYELFTNRLLFIVFKPLEGKSIVVHNNVTSQDVEEQAYALSSVFFCTMPAADLDVACEYWENIRKNVEENHISLDRFWSIADNRNFHVRPKAVKKSQLTSNPHGGMAEKYCYWFNPRYVKRIIDENTNHV